MVTEIAGVDVHAHGVPRRFVEELQTYPIGDVVVESIDDRSYGVTFPGARPLRPVAGAMLQFAERSAWLDEHLMAQQITAPWLDMHGQQLSEHEGQEWVRRLNDAMAEEMAATKGRMHAYATLHLADANSAIKELERAVSELAMVGAMIPTNLPSGKLTDDCYDAFWEAAQSLGAPISLHPPTISPATALFKEFPESGGFGRAIETTIIAAQLIIKGVLDRYPRLQLILVHGGGFLPYQAERLNGEAPMVNWANNGRRQRNELARPIAEYLTCFNYDSAFMYPASLRMLLEVAGTERVMVGSDYGARPIYPRSSIVHSLEAVNLSEIDEAKVLHKNAESLFSLN